MGSWTDYTSFSGLRPGLEKADCNEKPDGGCQGENEKGESQEKEPLLPYGAEHEQNNEIDAEEKLDQEGSVKTGKEKTLGVVQEILIVAQKVEKEEKHGRHEKEYDRSSRETGHPSEKTI
jgi:hypothetical protein